MVVHQGTHCYIVENNLRVEECFERKRVILLVL